MSKHLAPTIVMEILRHPAEELYGFHTLEPDQGWNIHPLGKGQPSYSRSTVLLSADDAQESRYQMTGQGYLHLVWDEIPEYLQGYLIGQEVALEFKVGLGVGNPELTSRVSVWVKGELPTARRAA